MKVLIPYNHIAEYFSSGCLSAEYKELKGSFDNNLVLYQFENKVAGHDVGELTAERLIDNFYDDVYNTPDTDYEIDMIMAENMIIAVVDSLNNVALSGYKYIDLNISPHNIAVNLVKTNKVLV